MASLRPRGRRSSSAAPSSDAEETPRATRSSKRGGVPASSDTESETGHLTRSKRAALVSSDAEETPRATRTRRGAAPAAPAAPAASDTESETGHATRSKRGAPAASDTESETGHATRSSKRGAPAASDTESETGHATRSSKRGLLASSDTEETPRATRTSKRSTLASSDVESDAAKPPTVPRARTPRGRAAAAAAAPAAEPPTTPAPRTRGRPSTATAITPATPTAPAPTSSDNEASATEQPSKRRGRPRKSEGQAPLAEHAAPEPAPRPAGDEKEAVPQQQAQPNVPVQDEPADAAQHEHADDGHTDEHEDSHEDEGQHAEEHEDAEQEEDAAHDATTISLKNLAAEPKPLQFASLHSGLETMPLYITYSPETGATLRLDLDRDDTDLADVDPEQLMKHTVITPDFEKKEALAPLRGAKKRKLTDTAGAKWFDMPAPEMTAEVKRDLQLIKMRNVIDPKRFYKKDNAKELPKFFQFGTIVEGKADFYSSRVPKRERKQNVVDELIADDKSKQYLKRRFASVQEKARFQGPKKNFVKRRRDRK